MPLPRVGQPISPGPSGKGLPRVAQQIVAAGLDVAGLATIGTLRILNRLSGNVIMDGYLQILDTNGVVRVEEGTMPARGISPAQNGLRVNDGSGNPIFDSLGLISSHVMGLLGTPVSNASQSNVTGNGSWQTVSGSTVSFNLSRATNVLTLAAGTVVDPTVGDTGFNLTASVLADGSPSGPTFAPGTASFPCTPWSFNSFAAGSHTVAFGVNQTNTHLWTAIGVYVFAFQLGG